MNTESNPTLSRRRLLSITMGLGGAVALNLAGCGKGGTAPLCADPQKLSDEQVSLRTSLHYTERAPGKDTCSDCAFFKSESNAVCGTCQLLKGPANPHGHCNSWSKREAATN
jgi:hypothetical protein